MTPEALWRRVVQVVGYTRDRKTRILEKFRGSDQPRQRQITLRWRQMCSKEPAHQRARQNTQLPRQLADCMNPWRVTEEKLKESPAIWWSPRQICTQPS